MDNVNRSNVHTIHITIMEGAFVQMVIIKIKVNVCLLLNAHQIPYGIQQN